MVLWEVLRNCTGEAGQEEQRRFLKVPGLKAVFNIFLLVAFLISMFFNLDKSNLKKDF